ncbi:hypothetical protein [Micromonospora sp. KC213]|uniref:hypothetical protein n=1 Tax=Micromonospora sp. KC213 TaxID=2530378 RepID=UPI0010448F89|nr:hypothetical protein [Micromonospora sp. KC213]TDC44157.1 hypothetical protein E1166_01260 [Micromonospora sp. KC213]
MSGLVLLTLSFPLLMLGITAWREANHEAGVRAWQLEEAASAADPKDREDFAEYAGYTLDRQQSAERTRNWLLTVAVLGAGGGIALLLPIRRRPVAEPASDDPAQPARDAAAEPAQDGTAQQPVQDDAGPPGLFRPCRACQWRISVEAIACPRCGCPHEPVPEQSAPVNGMQRAFYIALLVLGLGSATVIYTVLFDSLSETRLVQIAPYWLFPSVFGYYGLVAQRMEARRQTTHLGTVSEQLLNVIREAGGSLGQVIALLIHAPFLMVKSRRPWVVAFVGSLIWAIGLFVFLEVIFPGL